MRAVLDYRQAANAIIVRQLRIPPKWNLSKCVSVHATFQFRTAIPNPFWRSISLQVTALVLDKLCWVLICQKKNNWIICPIFCPGINAAIAFTPAGSALIVFRSSSCWTSSSWMWSVVEPTWLTSSNHWKPVCTEMNWRSSRRKADSKLENWKNTLFLHLMMKPLLRRTLF